MSDCIHVESIRILDQEQCKLTGLPCRARDRYGVACKSYEADGTFNTWLTAYIRKASEVGRSLTRAEEAAVDAQAGQQVVRDTVTAIDDLLGDLNDVFPE